MKSYKNVRAITRHNIVVMITFPDCALWIEAEPGLLTGLPPSEEPYEMSGRVNDIQTSTPLTKTRRGLVINKYTCFITGGNAGKQMFLSSTSYRCLTGRPYIYVKTPPNFLLRRSCRRVPVHIERKCLPRHATRASKLRYWDTQNTEF
jgi:hypothetical protein